MDRDDLTDDAVTGRGHLAQTLDPTPYRRCLVQGWSITKRHLLWIAVPLVIGLLSAVAVSRAIARGGIAVRPVPSFPAPVVDLWAHVGIPFEASGDVLTSGVVTLALSTVATGLVAGTYLGSLNDLLDHRRPSMWRNLRRFGVPVGLYTVLWDGSLATVGGVLAVSVPAGIVAALVYLVATYRLWATPYLVIVSGLTLPAAVGRAWCLSSGPGPYRQFSVYFLATTTLLSLFRFTGIVAGSTIGLAGSVPVFALLGTVLTVASLAFVRSHEADDGR